MQSITTAKQFNEVINETSRSIIKFQAGWCPDCRVMDMFIGPITEDYDQYEWYDVDRDVLPEIAEKYDVMGIPSLLIFENGEKKAHLHSANAKSPEQVTSFLEGLSI
ncbi:thioredoxin family protein [Sporosarcina gallistercoris]|uniref:Thioredoxin family protein n=1 Tax=Sporosarcina gallistercoris TaxID=2762245 RepID=A0ABR8PL45_9BACL|nr:thioredoxin family protein [Sporosarcina gallistercoris]MBD7908886.1 thioredoxin family protein [Sporosarcina gallistercoris]